VGDAKQLVVGGILPNSRLFVSIEIDGKRIADERRVIERGVQCQTRVRGSGVLITMAASMMIR
jgi:hypothetical protein